VNDEAIKNQLRSILTKAADCEASRQRAVQMQDWPRVAQLENELRRLWQQHGELERRSAA